ncbi:MAG TPA: hypothetical protein DCS83_01510 [Prevotella sp.]|nr:hypothetical protein [Prevotella sp.]
MTYIKKTAVCANNNKKGLDIPILICIFATSKEIEDNKSLGFRINDEALEQEKTEPFKEERVKR